MTEPQTTAEIDEPELFPIDPVRFSDTGEFSRLNERRRAIERLDNVFRMAAIGNDDRTALAAQREINKLLGLYLDRIVEDADDSVSPAVEEDEPIPSRHTGEAADIYDSIDSFLDPLGLSDDPLDGYPDIVRLAADEITQLRKKVQLLKPKRKKTSKSK